LDINKPIRTIAFHLPQFHPIPENDEWWGKGFTEWTNVAKAKRLYEGHYQPHLPADLGFYDLRLEESRLAQESLAKQYGIFGFCYYHYWFNGKRLLDEPINRKLANPKEDLPFMFCWANENWTRTWDGLDNHILIKQDYSPEDDLEHIKYLIPIFKDSRYIKIDGKPFIMIYKSAKLSRPEETIRIWRTEAKNHGLELYITRVENFGMYGSYFLEPGFDASVEFQPFTESLDQYLNCATLNYINSNLIIKLQLKLLKKFNIKNKYKKILIKIHNDMFKKVNYDEYVNYIKSKYEFEINYKKYPCVTPSWDNTARKGSKSFILHNSTPEKFKQWLSFVKSNYKPYSPAENFLFINAWNEWGEGNHLEPCQKFGKSYLNAVKEIFE
jgi:hypothetical protein